MKGFPWDTLKLCQLNAENLFVYLDKYKGENILELSEQAWQGLTSSTVPNKELVKLKDLAKTIELIDADVVMLNEIGGLESLENFNTHFLANKYRVKLIEGNSDRGIDVGYLIKEEKFARTELWTHRDRPIDFSYYHEHADEAKKSHYLSRDAAELRLFTNESSQIPGLVLLLTHLKSKLDPKNIDPLGRGRREAELKCLMDIYLDLRKEWEPKVPVVVAGDFNGVAQPTKCDREFKDIYERTDLRESFTEAEVNEKDRYTQVHVYPNRDPEHLQIDYIFVSEELAENILPEETHVFRYLDEFGAPWPSPKTMERRLQLPSDHYPVVLTLTSECREARPKIPEPNSQES